MKKRYPKRVNPATMITRFGEVFKSVGLKKPVFRNLLLVLIAISVARTFRVNEIASRLLLVVKREKSKQKRFLRFLDTPLPVDALKTAWFVSVVGWFSKDAGEHLYLLVIEHGFRDIKSCFGFGKLVLKKPTQARLDVLWLSVCLAYGLLFISYEKVASTHWQKAHNGNNRKTFSVITIIKRVLTDLWNQHFLISFFTEIGARGDPLFESTH